MPSEDNPGTIKRLGYFAKGGARAEAKLGHGPFGENSDTYVDAKPYQSYYSNGMFEGYDGSVWQYFKFPIDVQTEWLLNPEEALENQSPFLELTKELGQMLDSQTEKVRNDVRRNFHIQITQVESQGIKPPSQSTPAHADYLGRISEQYVKPEWYGFIGFQLLGSDIFYEAHGFKNRVYRYFDALKNPGTIRWTSLRKDVDDLSGVALKHGFTHIDFIDNPEYLEQLTAWHGIDDQQHALPRQLQNVRMKETVQGLSVMVPKWGEIQLAALKPKPGVNLRDPMSESARWAVPLYNPGSNVVLINIRGQVRAPSIADNLLDLKHIKKSDRRGGPLADSGDETFGAISVVDTIMAARNSVANLRLPMLDNLEVIVGYVVPPVGVTNKLPAQMGLYGMDVHPLIGRQHLGILSSFPTYPKKVLRIPRGNAKRPELSNVMLPGVIAMSGLFRSTKPCAPGGILLGLSDAGDEYKEIYTETDAASKYNKVPGMLVTGRPGAGKTQQLLQMTVQIAMQGLPVAFFNPKKEGTLKPTFDYIGGLTISMNRKYLEENPGMLDPVLFLDDRVEVGSLIADAIFTAGRYYDNKGSDAEAFRTKIRTEIVERSKDYNNTSAWDIIYGNGLPEGDPRRTDPISDPGVKEFVQNRIATAPFWRAFISKSATGSALREKLKAGRSFLIEWDRGMSLPDISTPVSEYKQDQLDTVISVNVTFAYASAIISGTGGAIIVDESWVLKSSREALAILERGGREWRQANIMLIMATQRIQDWMNAKAERSGQAATQNMATFFDRYLIMAIGESDPNEIDAFYDLTGQPRSDRMTYYMTHAGATSAGGSVKGNSVPRAFYMDRIYGWEGGIVCGPWPQKELNLGRTDKAGLAAKEAAALAAARPDTSGIEDASAVSAPDFVGALATIREEGQQRDRDLFEDQKQRDEQVGLDAEARLGEPVGVGAGSGTPPVEVPPRA